MTGIESTDVRLTSQMQRAALLGVMGACFESRFEQRLCGAPGTGQAIEDRQNMLGTIGSLVRDHREIGAYIAAMRDIAAGSEFVRVPIPGEQIVEELHEAARRIHEFVNPSIAPEDQTEAVMAHMQLADAIEAGPPAPPDHCEWCGAKEVVLWRERRPGTAEAVCEVCATQRGFERRGEMRKAIEALAFGVWALRDTSMTTAEIEETFAEILYEPHSIVELPLGSGPPWKHEGDVRDERQAWRAVFASASAAEMVKAS